MKRKYWILLSFLIPLITYTLIFYYKGLFTDKIILNSDMEAQYFPLFNYLKDVFNGDASIFYNMSKGLGGTMYGTIFYYLSSPLNLFLMFINKDSIVIFMTILVIIKLSLCGLTMYLYMSHKFKEDNFNILVFSLAYAFMGYNLNYYINIMWFDVVFLAPIVLIGIDRIIDNKSPNLYIITLFICIFSNYYIAYMLCIFAVLYFIYEILLKYNWKENKKIIIRTSLKFILISLFTGLMCSFIFIPAFLEIQNAPRENMKLLLFNPNFFNLFSKSFIGSLNLANPLNISSINIYCGTIMLSLATLFITNKKIKKKEKLLTIIIMSSFIMPIFLPILNYIWHLFSYPNGFNYRYSFLTNLFIIIIAYKSLKISELMSNNIIKYLICYILLSISFVFILKTNYYDYINITKILITNIIIYIHYIIVKKGNKTNKKKNKICILLFLELFLNLSIIFYKYNFYDINLKPIDEYLSVFKQNCLKKYRCEVNNYFTTNDSLYKNYNGITNFLSTSNKKFKIINIMNNYFEDNGHIYNYNNIVTDSILGVKTIGTDKIFNYYELTKEVTINDNKYYIYNNPDALKLGYMIKKLDSNLLFNYQNDNINNYGPEIQNKILNSLLNTNYKYYNKLKLEKNNNDIYKADLTGIDSQYLYIKEYDDNYIKKIYINNNEIKDYIYSNSKFVVLKNDYKETIEIKIETENSDEDVNIYYFNYDLFKKTINELKKNELDIEINTGNYIKGKIYVNTDKTTLMLTLLYEKGWEIYVDGVKTNYYEILNSFIGLDLSEGNHIIEMYYKQPGLKSGITVSIISVLFLIVYLYIDKRKNT